MNAYPNPLVTETTYFPTGAVWTPTDFDVMHHTVTVTWRGNDTYSVDWSGMQWMSSGRWARPHRDALRIHQRFTHDEAHRIAATLPDTVTVLGLTWAQWQNQK